MTTENIRGPSTKGKSVAANPYTGLKSLCKNVCNTWNWRSLTQKLPMNDIWWQFSEINLDSPTRDVILFLASKLGFQHSILTGHFFMDATSTKCYHYYKTTKLFEIWPKKTFNRIVEFTYCILLFDNSNEQSTQLAIAVTWSKSH